MGGDFGVGSGALHRFFEGVRAGANSFRLPSTFYERPPIEMLKLEGRGWAFYEGHRRLLLYHGGRGRRGYFEGFGQTSARIFLFYHPFGSAKDGNRRVESQGQGGRECMVEDFIYIWKS